MTIMRNNLAAQRQEEQEEDNLLDQLVQLGRVRQMAHNMSPVDEETRKEYAKSGLALPPGLSNAQLGPFARTMQMQKNLELQENRIKNKSQQFKQNLRLAKERINLKEAQLGLSADKALFVRQKAIIGAMESVADQGFVQSDQRSWVVDQLKKVGGPVAKLGELLESPDLTASERRDLFNAAISRMIEMGGRTPGTSEENEAPEDDQSLIDDI